MTTFLTKCQCSALPPGSQGLRLMQLMLLTMKIPLGQLTTDMALYHLEVLITTPINEARATMQRDHVTTDPGNTHVAENSRILPQRIEKLPEKCPTWVITGKTDLSFLKYKEIKDV